ncbi:MAG TPA: DNA phosphorothioation-associated putative methyltransferase, partial [Terriglobales bacterium]|nr:DNA phosphorothioation-associated putative methyltransferase [Terriglobales bacterium]
ALSLQLFARRKRFRELNARLQLDIKAFFGTYEQAQREALGLLHGISDVEKLRAHRDAAAAAGLGYVDEEGHLQLHVDLVRALPAQLRVFAGAATTAYGDLTSADLIKLHIDTGKVTLMAFDDFLNRPLPRMIQRVKVDMRGQDLQVFDYEGDFEPPFLYWKSRYINEETDNYPEQLAFDKQLAALNVIGDGSYGAGPKEFAASLQARRWEINGFKLIRANSVPDLDEKCGSYLTYRQLIECGETWDTLRIDNRPKSPDSYTALYDLATNILDPVIEHFGMVKLTYGFCSQALGRNIKGRIAPKLDQHSAHETRRNGSLVCERLGAAVDFLVEFEDMREVANWIARNTAFDRLYYYSSDRPLHISYGPQNSKNTVAMVPTAKGTLVPRKVTAGQL